MGGLSLSMKFWRYSDDISAFTWTLVKDLQGKQKVEGRDFQAYRLTGIAVSNKKMNNESKEGFQAVLDGACTKSSPRNDYLYILATLNFFLAITASVGNILIFAALRKVSSIRPNSKLLFRCLTTTDLLAGVSSQPLFAIVLISVTRRAFQVCYTIMSFNDVIGKSLAAVSLWTLTAISVDRILALKLGLKYKRVVTLRRMQGLLIFFWIFSVSVSCLYRFLNLKQQSIISRVYSGQIYLSLGISAFSYGNIYFCLRHRRQSQLQDDVHEGQQPPNERRSPLKMEKYRKTVSTALWVQLTLVACYLPYAIVAAIEHPSAPTHNISRRVGMTFVLLNSSLNPFLYTWKIRHVRRAVKLILRQWSCKS